MSVICTQGNSILRNQKKTLDTLALELQLVVSYPTWILGIEFGSSKKAVHALKD